MADRGRYLNRELAWIEFNARVLDEARDETVPLLERAKFLAILAKNLDEFAEVRVPKLRQAIEDEDERERDGYRASEVLDAADRRIRELEALANATWDALAPRLAAAGIRVVERSDWTEEHSAVLRDAWAKARPGVKVHPVPASGPFPLVKNGEPFLAIATRAGALSHVAILPASAPRLVKLPAREGTFAFARFDELAKSRVDELVPGARPEDAWLCRLSRDTNFYLDEGGQEELVRSIEENAHNDDEDLPVRLQFEARAASAVVTELARRHRLALEDLFAWGSLPDHKALFALASLDVPTLHDPPQPAIPHPAFGGATSLFSSIARKDVLLYHPFHAYDPIVKFVEEAARDPQVRSVHVTLYRTSASSPIVAALLEAAHAKKKVFALVEAKARFDEEANVARAKALEAAGAKVSLGVKGLKTHAKAILVEREEGGRTRRYAHLGTGNYNEKSAKLYTDLSLFTADDELTDELAEVFEWLEGDGRRPGGKRRRVWHAPDLLRDKLKDLIDRETDHAKAGRPARIIAKLNGIADHALVDELFQAANAGVQVDLIVRGACALRPGHPRMRVRRIVDRYLEHARVLYFSDGFPEGGKPDVYLSSADWMSRNLDKRVELLVKLRGDEFIAEILDYLELQLQDDVKGRALDREGRAQPIAPPESAKVRSQSALYDKLRRLAKP